MKKYEKEKKIIESLDLMEALSIDRFLALLSYKVDSIEANSSGTTRV